jgi:hypothetical protein
MGEEAQKRGLVFVWYGVGFGLKGFPTGHSPKVLETFLNVPICLSSLHCCYEDAKVTSMMNEVAKEGASKSVFRMRTHCGGHVECQSSLSTYGIPRQILPVRQDGSMKLEEHEHFLRRVSKDGTVPFTQQPEARLGGVVTPCSKDVLLGRGKGCYLHEGNIRMRNIVRERGHLYEEVSFGDRRRVVKDVLNLIKEGSVRFLREDGASWVEVDDEAAEKKVAAALRTLRGIRNAAASDEDQAASSGNLIDRSIDRSIV